MQLKELLADDDAVSPVIGVILMVAITVILAAVIGTFVLGLGDQVQDTSPNAQFTFNYDAGTNNGTMDITHDGGDQIDQERLTFTASGNGLDANHAGTNTNWDGTDSVMEATADASAGTTYTLVELGTADNGADLSGETVRVIWTSQSGDQTSTVARRDIPE
jgi:flagellin-like protein